MAITIEWHVEQIYTAIHDKDIARAREARIYARRALTTDEYRTMELALKDLSKQNRKPPTYFK